MFFLTPCKFGFSIVLDLSDLEVFIKPLCFRGLLSEHLLLAFWHHNSLRVPSSLIHQSFHHAPYFFHLANVRPLPRFVTRPISARVSILCAIASMRYAILRFECFMIPKMGLFFICEKPTISRWSCFGRLEALLLSFSIFASCLASQVSRNPFQFYNFLHCSSSHFLSSSLELDTIDE